MNKSDTSNKVDRNNDTQNHKPDRLTIFTFLWACQALVHQEFYSKWLDEGNVFGWLLSFAAVAVLLNPRSLRLFSVMLIISVIYNVLKWPFVVNHILVETIVNLTVLGSIAGVMIYQRGNGKPTNVDQRNHIFDRFAPVVKSMLIVMYYFAFVAKLNYDFFDPELSCVVAMYDDLVRRVPFVPTGQWAQVAAIWSTVIIEAAIPLLLTFRRTRYLAIMIGLPFHFMLGLIGHRTFSALAYALYALFLISPLSVLTGEIVDRLRNRYGPSRLAKLVIAARISVVVGVGFFIAADFTGHYESGVGPLRIFRFAWAIWIVWSLVICVGYVATMVLHFRRRDSMESEPRTAGPGWLWAMLLLVFLNGMSQYLGLKTETCFTMYSNLRTEGHINNHLFMPAFRLVGYQDDLVEVIETDHSELKTYVDRELLVTYFELRRVLSGTQQDCLVIYRRADSLHTFERRNQQATDSELSAKHPILQAKLLYFRPVPKGNKMHCQH